MKLQKIRLPALPMPAGPDSLVNYYSSDPGPIEEVLEHGGHLGTQPIGGTIFGLRKGGGRYFLSVTPKDDRRTVEDFQSLGEALSRAEKLGG